MTRSSFMKKFFQGAALFFSILLALPLFLMVAANVGEFVFFYSHLSHRDTSTCLQYYEGVNKGSVWEDGEWCLNLNPRSTPFAEKEAASPSK